MATSQTSIRIAQVFGLGGAAWLSGNIFSLSLLAVPGLQNSYSHIQTQQKPKIHLPPLPPLPHKISHPPPSLSSGTKSTSWEKHRTQLFPPW
ncbi:hypothetical protein VTL71DRAFT_4839 [Oculimacula yallundae]|uniref:Uncharacterized protein n=1 Tax=Oculimacula yallundae TaxID=86028 RepID=A0ABR4C3W1_9HELO